ISQRQRHKVHDPPKKLKQYAWKAFKVVPEVPADETDGSVPNSETAEATSTTKNPTKKSTAKTKEATKKKATKKKATKKQDGRGVVSERTKMIRRMDKEHPFSTLDVGTTLANVKAALRDDEEETLLAQEVMKCLQEASRLAAITKRECQRLVSMFIETITAQKTVSEADRLLLDYICPRDGNLNGSDDGDDKEDDEADEESGKKGEQIRFLKALLHHLYSGKAPSSATKFGHAVNEFIRRTKELGLYKDLNVTSHDTGQESRYAADHLLDSVASELGREFTQHWVAGSRLLQQTIQTQQKKSGQQDLVSIRADLSAVENFALLNNMLVNPWQIAPLTSIKQPFIGFSEHQLLHIFFKNPVLQKKIRQLIGPKPYTPSQEDAVYWLNKQAPGSLLTALITPVGRGRNQKGRRDYRYMTTTMTTEAMGKHVDSIRDENFDVSAYMNKYNITSTKEYRYVLRGYIRTNGFRLQLLAYKMKELQGARFKRFSEDRLPPRLTTTVAGTGDYLREIRNVIKTPQDITDLFGDCDPKQIKVLALDLGQAYVLAANVYLPEPLTSASNSKPKPETYCNLTVSQKAVMQPTFAFRRWMEFAKAELPEGASQSVSEIESGLPPLRGQEGSIVQHTAAMKNVEGTLDKLYNEKLTFKKHAWDSKKAKEAEYAVITDRLLKIVGGTIGEKRKADNPVIIAIGLGDFNPASRLSSLHGTFRSFFINKARSLGYVVIGCNEYYTSKKCPTCHRFVGQVTITPVILSRLPHVFSPGYTRRQQHGEYRSQLPTSPNKATVSATSRCEWAVSLDVLKQRQYDHRDNRHRSQHYNLHRHQCQHDRQHKLRSYCSCTTSYQWAEAEAVPG
ncbi:hypothetical protein EC968_005044, partial [Mortierella alpina]